MAGFFKKLGRLFTGTPEKRENVSTLRPEQEPLYNQAVNAGIGPGAGGAFGESADYYRSNLSNNPQDFDAMAAPELRRYNEQIAPDIAEQFAGLGSGGLSSSGHRNAQNMAGVDLSERLAALRAQLRQSSAAGLQSVGNAGLQNYSQNMVTQAGSPGLLGTVAPAIGSALTAAGTSFGGPALGAASSGLGSLASNWFGGRGNKVGANTPPLQGGNNIPASPQQKR